MVLHREETLSVIYHGFNACWVQDIPLGLGAPTLTLKYTSSPYPNQRVYILMEKRVIKKMEAQKK